MQIKEENINRIYAMILTAIVTLLLFLLCWFLVFHTPLPPYSEGGGGGIEVNFGNSDNGFGDVQHEELYPVEMQMQKSSAAQINNDESEIMTQDLENAPALNSPKEKKLKKKKEKEIVKADKETKKQEVVKIAEPVVNALALYKKKPSTAQGITQGNGDQGKTNGTYNSSNYNGDGGSGGGQGGGDGTGIGPGKGPGVGPGSGGGHGVGNYQLKGRKPLFLPKPNNSNQEQGKVIVEIKVDRQGNVTRATAGAQGTTTTNQYLWKQAENAAMRSKWDINPNAAEEQKGTITYIFILQN